jgi:post-segregation antitoxin (ccd killing protein)
MESMVIAWRIAMTGRAYQRSYPGRIASVAKLSVSVPDDLLRDLRTVAHDNVSAFVTAAVRNELDRRRLSGFVEDLEEDLGPVDETEVAKFSELFAASAAAGKADEDESP